MDKKNTGHRPMVGGSSLLIIFAVLCLVTFALLMLTTETSARRLSEVSAEANLQYYEADHRAEVTFANLRAGKVPSHVTVKGKCFSYTEQISDTRFLCVELEYTHDRWTVLRWQVISTVR